MARRYLLSIDGGGVRGVIPAVALTKLEATTGRPTRETFSFVAGTSTGAIVAAALGAGIPATRIVELYVDRSREVFTGVTLLNTLRRVFTGSTYSTRKLRDVIAEELGPEHAAGLLMTRPSTCSSPPRASPTASPGTSSRTIPGIPAARAG